MTDTERRTAIERYLRQLDKPHMTFKEPELCHHCGVELNPDTPRYWFHFKDWTGCARSFRSICIAANTRRKYA